MVAIDTTTGSPVRISGAALAGGPALVLAAGRRLENVAHTTGGTQFPSFLRGPQPAAVWQPSQTVPYEALAPRQEFLPSQWGIPTFYGGAPFGPPYELSNRTAEWELSAETTLPFHPVNQQARMAQRVHPRGPALHSAGTFLAALYGTTPTPRYLGVGVDTVR